MRRTAAEQEVRRGETPLIAFEGCRLPLPGETQETFLVDLSLDAGDFLLVQVGDAAHDQALADAARGLLDPIDGRVCFSGSDWRELPHEVADACRGRIGSSLSEHDWLPYLSVLDNLLMPQLYHSRRSIAELCAEAASWARRFGLPGVPDELPSAVPREERRRSSLVRAFMSEPLLVLLEQQRGALPSGLEAEVINAVSETRQRGGAVLWLTRDAALFRNQHIPASQRLRLFAGRLQSLEAA